MAGAGKHCSLQPGQGTACAAPVGSRDTYPWAEPQAPTPLSISGHLNASFDVLHEFEDLEVRIVPPKQLHDPRSGQCHRTAQSERVLGADEGLGMISLELAGN